MNFHLENQSSGGEIYLDYAATSPVDPRVLDAMIPYFTQAFGNAASRNHSFGWKAEEAVEKSREQFAAVIGATAKEIIFTSGATESNNLAIQGAAEMYREKGNHVITCLTEHKAVLDPCKYLETQGFDVTYLGVDRYGMIDLEELEKAITDRTILITLMFANNEIGSLHPVKKIGELAHSNHILFHTDATQAAGKIPIDVNDMKIDLLSVSAHKIYGPKGVGALYVRRKNPRVRLAPLMHGGGHERGMRSGTLNVPGIVGIGAAFEIAARDMEKDNEKILGLRKRLYEGLTEKIDYIEMNTHATEFLPGILNLSFSYIEGESLMMGIEGIAVSSGSACTSASLEPSYVLKSTGIGDELAHSSIRFSIGRFTTEDEIDEVVRRMSNVVNKLREMSPLYEMVQEGIDLETIEWTAH